MFSADSDAGVKVQTLEQEVGGLKEEQATPLRPALQLSSEPVDPPR